MTKTLNDHETELAPEFEKATALRDQGELGLAIDTLRALIDRLRPEDTRLTAHAYMQLGNLYTKLGLGSEREAAFRAAVEVSPRRELASLGLFHALMSLGRTTDAYQEMVRLLRLRDSQLYRELLSEGFEGSSLEHEAAELVRVARGLLEEHTRN